MNDILTFYRIIHSPMNSTMNSASKPFPNRTDFELKFSVDYKNLLDFADAANETFGVFIAHSKLIRSIRKQVIK
jgi:hypothetical protein